MNKQISLFYKDKYSEALEQFVKYFRYKAATDSLEEALAELELCCNEVNMKPELKNQIKILIENPEYQFSVTNLN